MKTLEAAAEEPTEASAKRKLFRLNGNFSSFEYGGRRETRGFSEVAAGWRSFRAPCDQCTAEPEVSVWSKGVQIEDCVCEKLLFERAVTRDGAVHTKIACTRGLVKAHFASVWMVSRESCHDMSRQRESGCIIAFLVLTGKQFLEFPALFCCVAAVPKIDAVVQPLF